MKYLILPVLIFSAGQAFAGLSDSSQYYFNKGQEEMQAKKYLVAAKHFDKAISFNPNFTAAYLENARVNLEMRKTNVAMENFKAVLKLDPNNKPATQGLMELYYNYRQYNNASELALKCKDCPNAKKILGMSEYQQENYPEAEKHLLAAIKDDPKDAEAVYTLARTYIDMEFYKKAVPYYEMALQLDPAKSNWRYELGLISFNNYDYKKALSSFQAAAEKGYTVSNDFKENMGITALYAGDYDLGEKLVMEVFSRKPGAKDLLRDAAEILHSKKQYQRSLTYCQKLMEADPKDAKALYQAGLNFQKMGQKDRGMQMCDKAIEMDPSLESLRRKKEMPGGL